jgi:hypothetical protein
VGPAPGGLRLLPEIGDGGGEIIEQHVDRDPAVAVLDHAGASLGGGPAEEDRRMRPLHGLRVHTHRRERVELVGVLGDVGGPEPSHDLEIRARAPGAARERYPEGGKSSASQPIPMPKSTRPRDSTSSVATSFAV